MILADVSLSSEGVKSEGLEIDCVDLIHWG